MAKFSWLARLIRWIRLDRFDWVRTRFLGIDLAKSRQAVSSQMVIYCRTRSGLPRDRVRAIVEAAGKTFHRFVERECKRRRSAKADPLKIDVHAIFQRCFPKPPAPMVPCNDERAPTLWGRVTRFVKKHPWATAAIGIGVLVASVWYVAYRNRSPSKSGFRTVLYCPEGHKNDDLCSVKYQLFSASTVDTPERKALCQKTGDQMRLYAQDQGYGYASMEGTPKMLCRNHSTRQQEQCQPYWLKIYHARRLLQQSLNKAGSGQPAGPKWFVHLDSGDMVITDHNKNFDYITDTYGKNPKISVIVTEDKEPNSLNTGVMLIRNTKHALKVLNKVWKKRNALDHIGSTLGLCKNQSCFHEQQALEELRESDPKIHDQVAVIPQRINGIGMNVFDRWDHFDSNRWRRLEYNDPEHIKGRRGDFITHCTGMATKGYDNNRWVRNLQSECVDKLIAQTIRYRPPSTRSMNATFNPLKSLFVFFASWQ